MPDSVSTPTPNQATIDALVTQLETAGVESEDLDELVHDLCEQDAVPAVQSLTEVDDDEDHIEAIYDAAGERAAAINNAGLPGQVGYLLTALGSPAAVLQAIKEV